MNYNKIALIGMMGSGKTTTAYKLAEKINFSVLELDEIFEHEQNSKIKDFFKNYGEDEFRKIETKILLNALNQSNSIISTGGGIILKEENRKLLFNKDVLTIYLSASSETIYNRIKSDTTRPLLLVQDPKKEIEKILNKRKKYYELASITIQTDDKTVQKISEEIVEKIWKK